MEKENTAAAIQRIASIEAELIEIRISLIDDPNVLEIADGITEILTSLEEVKKLIQK